MGFIIAHCPECGEEVSSDDIPQPLRLYTMMAALLVHAATIDSLMQLEEYAEAKPGWDERIEYLTTNLDRETREMEMFGEAFDDSEE